jgi:uncharacterized protein (TIGR00251 family)
MKPCVRSTAEGLLLDIKAQPGASKTEILGLAGERLRVRIAAAPEDGRANAELTAFLAGLLGCPKKAVWVKTGERSRLKTLRIPGEYREKLEGLLEN